LKKISRKGCHIFAAHIEEEPKEKVVSIEDHLMLRDFEDVFKETIGFTPKRVIDFCIDLVPGATSMSNTPYRMGTPELKELQM
jgi:hypothetical protein